MGTSNYILPLRSDSFDNPKYNFAICSMKSHAFYVFEEVIETESTELRIYCRVLKGIRPCFNETTCRN